MTIPVRPRARRALAGGLLLVGALVAADAAAASAQARSFSDFTPLATSAGPTADEAAPITFGNPAVQQRSIIARADQLEAGIPNSGNFDMNTTNESGRKKGRFLFTVFETGQAGVQRHDLKTGRTETLWYAPNVGDAVAFDASFWTPWGTFVTAEESWCTAPCTAPTINYGRLFELKNPTTAPGITEPLTASSNAGAHFVHQNVIPRTSHEGIQFDQDLSMYFIDELNGGSIYKYVPAASKRQILSGRKDYFAGGTTYVLRVGDGTTPNATGAYTWVPFTDGTGAPLPGALTVTDGNGVTSVDARNTTNLAPFRGTDYQRPEDLQIQVVRGREYLYVATTTTNEVYRLDLKGNAISVFANTATTDLATGAAVGSTAFTSPDNLAIDNDGYIYIVEDRNGGVDNDIWMAKDLNRDGDLTDPGEGVGRWASNGTVGSEFTGLYFDPADSTRAWVNIQHPSSGNDRTIEICISGHTDV